MTLHTSRLGYRRSLRRPGIKSARGGAPIGLSRGTCRDWPKPQTQDRLCASRAVCREGARQSPMWLPHICRDALFVQATSWLSAPCSTVMRELGSSRTVHRATDDVNLMRHVAQDMKWWSGGSVCNERAETLGSTSRSRLRNCSARQYLRITIRHDRR